LEPVRVTIGEDVERPILELLPSDESLLQGGGRLAAREQAHVERFAELESMFARLPEVFHGHLGAITTLELAGGDRLVTASQDRTIRVWKLDRAQEPSVVLSGVDDRVEAMAVGVPRMAAPASRSRSISL
jgi:WD40 repeat protein